MNTFQNLVFYDHGQVSHTKFWSNVGYFLMCCAFIIVTCSMLTKPEFPAGDWVEVFAAFGAIVAIPRGFSKWVAYKTKAIGSDDSKCCKSTPPKTGEQELTEG